MITIGVRDIDVTVIGGTGTAIVSSVAGGEIHGILYYVGIKAPTTISVFTLSVYDRDGFLLYTENPITGIGYVAFERPINSNVRITLTTATNGVYNVRLRYAS